MVIFPWPRAGITSLKKTKTGLSWPWEQEDTQQWQTYCLAFYLPFILPLDLKKHILGWAISKCVDKLMVFPLLWSLSILNLAKYNLELRPKYITFPALPSELYPQIKVKKKKIKFSFNEHTNKNVIEIPSLEYVLQFLKAYLKDDPHILLFCDIKTCNA